MRTSIYVTVFLSAAVAACSQAPGPSHSVAVPQANADSAHWQPRVYARTAKLPGAGKLMRYETESPVVRAGAQTWHSVAISEEHAFRSIYEGELEIPTPDGSTAQYAYERHVELPDGNWTWVGRAADGRATILTFGEKAVFGSIAYGEGEPLVLTTMDGGAWLVETDTSQLSGESRQSPDFVPAPDRIGGTGHPVGMPIATASSSEAVGISPAAASTTIDVLLGYTASYAARLGGQSQAVTRLAHLAAITNQAYADSQVDAEIRVVGTMQVDYPDATSNPTALFELTGVACTTSNASSRRLPDRGVNCTAATRPAALQQLVSVRERLGADLVALVRSSDDSQAGSCGLSWLLGGGQNPIDASNADFAFSVVTDTGGGQGTDGAACREDYLAHELGHNMGLQHDAEFAAGSDDTNNDGNVLDPEEYGRLPYSFGYVNSTANFYTIMSIRRGGFTGYRVFSNPRISSCGGMSCGIPEQSDNARALAAATPLIAAFRAPPDALPEVPLADGRKRDINNDGRSDLLWTLADRTHWAYWLMNSGSIVGSASFPMDPTWRAVATGDFNNDDHLDVVWSNGLAMQMWVGSASGYTGVGMRSYPTGWKIVGVGDVNADGRSDLLWRDNETTMLSVWLMSGASIVGSAAYPVPGPWRVLATGNFNADARLDVVWTDGTAVQMWLGTAQGFTGAPMPNYPTNWSLLGVGDFDGDGLDDLIWRLALAGEGYTNIWRMSGGNVIGGFAFANAPAWSPVDVGDFSGDGRVDIVWTNGQHMQMWTSLGNGFGGVAMGTLPIGWDLIRR